jgi:hypothetical protein
MNYDSSRKSEMIRVDKTCDTLNTKKIAKKARRATEELNYVQSIKYYDCSRKSEMIRVDKTCDTLNTKKIAKKARRATEELNYVQSIKN